MLGRDIEGEPEFQMEERLLGGGWTSPAAERVAVGHGQGSDNTGDQIAVLMPEGLPQLSPSAARALLRLLRAVAESDGRGARGPTRAA
jgi:hypothetical protein